MNLLQQIVVAFALLSVAVPAQAGPPALCYKAPTENVQYSVKITVDTPAEKNTYQGRITYEGSVDGSDTLRLTYQGGLSKSSQKKITSWPGRPFGDPFGGRSAPRPPMAPFGRFRDLPTRRASSDDGQDYHDARRANLVA